MISSAIRDKAQRLPGQSLDGKGVQVDEYKDNPANRRPSSDDGPQPEVKATSEEPTNQVDHLLQAKKAMAEASHEQFDGITTES